jgi:hypothetical protein
MIALLGFKKLQHNLNFKYKKNIIFDGFKAERDFSWAYHHLGIYFFCLIRQPKTKDRLKKCKLKNGTH